MDPAGIPKECNGLGALFVSLINDMKNSTPSWDDFINKTNKLNSALKVVSQALSAFFDAFQKIADLATNAQGATKEIGATLTRLCIRQKAMEDKTRVLSKLLVESVSGPLAEKLEGEWKKTYLQLDKERMKDLKKVKAELKKASNDTLRLKKKAGKKGAMMSAKGNLEQQLKVAMEDLQDRYNAVEDAERKHVRRALIEERARFCHFIVCLKPVLDCQLGMLNDMSQISELLDSLCMQASDPESLPSDSEALLMNMHAGSTTTCSAAESSSLGSRKSSMASISSLTSNSSAGSGPSPAHQLPTKSEWVPPPKLHIRGLAPWKGSLYRRSGMTQPAMRLSSISSQDSGFTSQDTLYLHGLQALKSMDYQFMRTASGPSLSSSGGASKLPGAEGILDASGRDEDTAEGSGADSDTEGEDGEEDEDEEDDEEEEDAKTPCTPPPEETFSTQDRHMDRPHTISGAFTSQTSRPSLSAMTFEPSPAELYPNQALPPPVYANLANLAQAASRKCSIPAGMERTPPPKLAGNGAGVDQRRMTLPAVPTAAALQQQQQETAGSGKESSEFQAELDRAVSELDRLTADMLADVDELWQTESPPAPASPTTPVPSSGGGDGGQLGETVREQPNSPGSASNFPLPPSPLLRRNLASHGGSPHSSNSASPPPLPPPPANFAEPGPPPPRSQYAPMRAASMCGPAPDGQYGVPMRRRPFPDPASKPPPPMRRNSAMASGPSTPEPTSPAARSPAMPPSPGPLPPTGLLRSISSGSNPDRPPPTSPKPKGVHGLYRAVPLPTTLPGPGGDSAAMPPPPAKFASKPGPAQTSPNFSGARRHSSSEAQSSGTGVPPLTGRKGSFQAPSNAAGYLHHQNPQPQQGGNCMAELTSVLKQRLHSQHHQPNLQMTPEQLEQQQQFLHKQQLLQQQQQQYVQQLQQQQQKQQQQQHSHPQQKPQQQIYAQQQFLPQHNIPRQQPPQQQPPQQQPPQQQPPPPQQQQPQQQSRPSRDPSPEDTGALSAALRAQGLRLRPTLQRNDRSAPNFG